MSDQQPEPRPDQQAPPPPPYGQQPPGQGQAPYPPGQQPYPPGPQPYPPGQQPYGQGQQPYQQYPTGPGPGAGYSNELSPADQRMWAMLGHLGAILFGFLAPLIVFLVHKERGRYVREQSAEALNFNITLTIGYVIIAVLTVVTFGLAGLLYIPLVIVNIVFPILGGLAANRGENYRYPFAWRPVT